jgi:hypothetical protein
VIPKGPLALVPNPLVEMLTSPRWRLAPETNDRGPEEEATSDFFGDIITKKEANILRIGFQNIGGVPLQKNKYKDDIIRTGISKMEFDIFGIAEVNVNWNYIAEEH